MWCSFWLFLACLKEYHAIFVSFLISYSSNFTVFWISKHCSDCSDDFEKTLPPPPPLLSIHFFDTRNFVKHRRDPLRSFSVPWDKKFSTKPWCQPLLCMKIFDTTIFLKHRKGLLRSFSVLWDKNISTENLDTTPPLLSINFFANGNFLRHSTEGFLYEIFRYCETKKFRHKIVT